MSWGAHYSAGRGAGQARGDAVFTQGVWKSLTEEVTDVCLGT